MRRRTLLTGIGTVAFAGCLSEGGVDGDDPVAVTRAWGEAIISGSSDQIRDLTHPDGPITDRLDDSVVAYQPDRENAGYVDDVVAIDENESEAITELALGVENDTIRAVVLILRVTLRRHGGAWRVWEAERTNDD